MKKLRKYRTTAMRLKDAMYEKQMSATDLSRLSGVSNASISQYTSGAHVPSNLNAAKLARVLGVSPLYLMGFDVDAEDLDAKVTGDDYAARLKHAQETLNKEGMRRLVEYAEDLLASGRYEKMRHASKD